jgi:hypothetical protein
MVVFFRVSKQHVIEPSESMRVTAERQSAKERAAPLHRE